MLVTAAGVTVAAGGGSSDAASTLALCGNDGTPPPISHVVVMFLENAGYHSIIGSPSAPYINKTLTARCGVATHEYAATHTSAANYLALAAGEFPPGSPAGCGTVAACSSSAPSLFSQMGTGARGWQDFVEGAPSNCDPKTVKGVTKIGHDPGLFFTNVNCLGDVLPVHSLTQPDNGTFWGELEANQLPGFTWISPNQDHIGENGRTLASQDSFLSQFLPLFLASAAYQSGSTALIVTEDEGTGSDSTVGEDCTNEAKDLSGARESCHVPLWVVYPYNPGVNNGSFFDPYSATKGVDDIFGLPYIGHAGDGNVASLAGHFGLSGP